MKSYNFVFVQVLAKGPNPKENDESVLSIQQIPE